MSMMEQYNTSDLQLATTLYTLGYELLSLDRSEPRRVVFVFKPSDAMNDDIRHFYADKLSINPRQLFAANRLMKERLYGEA
jgi:hypothetical protein